MLRLCIWRYTIIQSVFGLSLFCLLLTGALPAHAASDIQPITFLDSPDPVPATGMVNYFVIVQNNDPDNPATNPVLTVTVPAGFTFASADDAACTYSGSVPSLGDAGDKVICTWGSPLVTSRTIHLDYIASATPGTYTVEATATATNDSNPSNNTEINITDVVESADLELVSKTSSPNRVEGGGIVTYQFEVKNNGPFAASNLVLNDTLPTGLTFFADNASPDTGQDSSWTCSASGQDVSCTSASLGVDATSTFYFRIRATSASVGFITNSASVSSVSPEPDPDNNTAEDSLQIIEGTDMAIAKAVNTSPVIGGAPAQFTLTVTNVGPMSAADVEVTDSLPSGYTDIAVTTIPLGWTCDPVIGTIVTCRIAGMTSGQSNAIVLSATPPVVPATVTHQNGATVSTTTPDPISSNDAILVDYLVQADIADLAISKSKGPSPVVQGSEMTSTISVRNNGPREADVVHIVDELSLGESFVSASGNWSCTPPGSSPGGQVSCYYNLVPLASGSTTTALTIVTSATNTGFLTNIACTGGSGESEPPFAGDSETNNNCNGANGATVLSTSQSADLEVTKVTSDEVITVDMNSFIYTITVVNNGPDTAEAVDFNDIIPQYVSAGSGGRPATSLSPVSSQGTCDTPGAGLVHCSLGSIAAGATATVTITVSRPMADGMQTNTASAYATLTGDPDRNNNQGSVQVDVKPVTDIEVTDKLVTYATHPAAIRAETIATYTIGIRNNGPSLASSVVLEDTFSGEAFEFIDAVVAGGGTCTWTAPTLSCDLLHMNSGSTKSITVRIRPDHIFPNPPSWQIDNTATVSMDPGITDSNTDNNTKALTMQVQDGSADLTVEKNESPSFTEPVRFDPDAPVGMNYIVYEVVVSNRGPSRATNVTFTDKVVTVSPLQTPAQQLMFVRDTEKDDGSAGSSTICSISGVNPFSLNGGPDIDCILPDPLLSGEDFIRYLVFEVLTSPDSLTGDSYNNTVTVNAEEPDPNQINNTEDENTTVRTIVDLEIVKTSAQTTLDPNRVEVQQPFTFTLTTTNHGPGISPEAQFGDNLPGGMVLTAQPFVSANPDSITVSCSGETGDTSFSCTLGQMNVSDTFEITVPVKLVSYPSGGIITNTATVTGIAPEPVVDPHPNTDSHTVGVLAQAVIGDKVWLDRDGDGIQDGGEAGLNGVTVNLLNGSGTFLTSTTTAGGGFYSFTVNSAGSYIVEFIKLANDFPSPRDMGVNDAVDSDADQTDGRSPTVMVTYGDVNNSIDAGFYEKLALGNRVWLDSDADGLQDAGELGIGGIFVELLDESLSVIGSTTTDSSGLYIFSNLVPGNYSVQITPPAWAGYLAGPVQVSNPNNDVNTDSNIAGTPAANVFRSGIINLNSRVEPNTDGDTDRNTNLTLDFGLVLPAALGNNVWLDENSDGIQDAGEPGIAGISIQLRNGLGSLIATTVTDTDGGYLFKGLAPGAYFVKVDAATLPVGLSQTTLYPLPGGDLANQNQSAGDGYGVALVSSGENLTADFGYNWSPTTDITGNLNTGAIGDRVWIDGNANGVQDNGETGVEGVVLTLYGAGADGFFGSADDIILNTATTDAGGKYIFDDLAAGAYVVEVSDSSSASHDVLDSAGYQQSGDPDHFSRPFTAAVAGTAGDSRTTLPVILAPGDTFINVDFGYNPQPSITLFSIGDTVWLDLDGDGLISANENGIGGVTVGLQNDSGAFLAVATTALDGSYLFAHLADNQQYTVVIVDSANVLAGLIPTYDSDSGTTNPDARSTLTLAGTANLEQDFGFRPVNPGSGDAAIGDTIYLDRNGSSSFDAGEGLEGIRVFLRDNGGNLIAVVFTDENGQYVFSGLGAGNYTVEVDTTTLPTGVTNSVDPDSGYDSRSSVGLAAGEINLLQDFGYFAAVPNSIGNLIWLDSNGDGVYQPNGVDGASGSADDETGIEGVTLELYRDLNGNGRLDPGEPLIGRTVSDINGAYIFSGLPNGSYLVDVATDGGLVEGYFHSRGTTGLNNNSQADYYAVSVTGGAANLTADFGYFFAPGSLGNMVWQDVDVDGLYDGAIDTELAGITVYLDIEYPDGTAVTVQTSTDSDGIYSFAGLLADENFNGFGTLYGTGGDEPMHTVRVDTSTLPANIVSIYPTRARNTDATTVGGVSADDEEMDSGSDNPAGEPAFPPRGGADITNDFGYFLPGSIGDTIWNDQDNDGLIDTGEGLAGVTVRLTPPADVNLGDGLGVSVTMTTAGDGSYLFSGLAPGEYEVTVVQSTLPAYLQGYNTVDPDGGYNSTAALTLAIGENNLDQDFAYFRPSALGDLVWDDSNGNGLFDNGESGHQGIAVQLLDGSGNPVKNPLLPGVDYIVQTDNGGNYLFENLLPGNYQIHFMLPASISFTTQDSSGDDNLDSDADPTTGRAAVVLGPNEINLTVDAGLIGPAINIEKTTNTVDADAPPGVLLSVGDAVTWEYVVTNTGNVQLINVAVSDSREGIVSCPEHSLAPGASMTCSISGTAVAGQYDNTAQVIATPPSGPAVTDSDPSHYLAGSPVPAIDIEKYTNGIDADTGTGPIISTGDVVTWTYVVTNTGTVELTAIMVNDDREGGISCPQTTLAVGQSMTCVASGIASAGQYSNIGTVTGTPLSGQNVTDSDPSHYIGSTPGSTFAAVDIEKATNGRDADSAPGPYAEIDHTVTWSYLVRNIGDVDLHNVTVTDDRLTAGDIHCPNDGNTDNSIVLLPVGAGATCTASGTAVAGQYANTGSVVATPPTGPNVIDSDPSHYYGSNGSISIKKYTNGVDADTRPGPTARTGKEVYWTYVVSNTGLFSLTEVTVSDDMGEIVTCPKSTLVVNESMTCTAQGIAIEGQYRNVGTVTGRTPVGETVSAADPSHYLGSDFIWQLFLPIITSSCPPVPDYCYIVADGDNQRSTNSPLFSYVFSTNSLKLLNRLGVDDVETITLSPDGKTLYAADKGVLGVIDPTPGIVGSFTAIDAGGVGNGRGALGVISVDDIDGLAFDPTSGVLYGSVRHGDGMVDEGKLDLLIKINPALGRIIADGFGKGVDYLVIQSASIGANDVDDIAFDVDGTLFGIAGNSGSGGDHLIIIDKINGGTTDFGALQQNGMPVQDMEGLTLYNSRELYGTTGLEFTKGKTDNTLYRIDKNSGESLPITPLKQNFNGYVPRDFEAITCFPVCRK